MSAEKLPSRANRANRLSTSVVNQILRDPRTVTNLYDPSLEYNVPPSAGLSLVPEKSLILPNLPGYGDVDMSVYDIMWSSRDEGRGLCDIGICKILKPDTELRSFFKFFGNSAEYQSNVYVDDLLAVPLGQLSSNRSDVEWDLLESKVRTLMSTVEASTNQ